MEAKGTKHNFIAQAGILAAAGIISRIIGLLYRSPLHRVIGDLGMGYFQSAHAYYTIILLISSYSIPSAISKVIAQKLAMREYKNAHRIFRCAIYYVLIVGGIASALLFFGAGLFVSKEAVPVLRTLAPTVFVYGILGVLRGYFQAHKSMVQTSASQIIEQIANALVSIGAAWLLIRLTLGSLEVPTDEALVVDRATVGAIGSAMGTGAGVLVALLFMAGIYALNKALIHKRIEKDTHEAVDSYGSIFKMITMVVTPFILSTAIYNLSTTVNNTVYTKFLPMASGADTVEIYSRWGVFSGQAMTISNIPIAFASAMAAAMLPTVAQLSAAKNESGAREKIGVAVKTTMLISIPCAVGLFALARPITGLLFRNTQASEDLATGMLMALALSVVFFALSTLNSQILQGLGKLNAPIVNAGIALALQTLIAVGLVLYTDLDLYGIVIATTLYALILCILNQRSVRKAIDYKQEVAKTFVIPFASAAMMGGLAWAVYEGLLLLTKSPSISVIPAIAVSVPFYFVMLLIFRGVNEQDLRNFPKGHLLVKVAKKLHLLK